MRCLLWQLTVKLRGRARRDAALRSNEALQSVPKRPRWRRGHTIFPSARGANQTTPHGPLQRLLGPGRLWSSAYSEVNQQAHECSPYEPRYYHGHEKGEESWNSSQVVAGHCDHVKKTGESSSEGAAEAISPPSQYLAPNKQVDQSGAHKRSNGHNEYPGVVLMVPPSNV